MMLALFFVWVSDAGPHEYDVAMRNYAFRTCSSNSKSNYYYKDFKNSWFGYAEDHEILQDCPWWTFRLVFSI